MNARRTLTSALTSMLALTQGLSAQCGESLLYVLQPEQVSTADLVNAGFSMLVLEPSRDGGQSGDFTAAEVTQMQVLGPQPTTVLAYLSIGEAEDYRDYWNDAWVDAAGEPIPGVAPAWLGPVNPDWPGNYKTRYWHEDWQALLFGTPSGPDLTPLDRIIDQGFDGVYLDIVDGYQYWSDEEEIPAELTRVEARGHMIDLIEALADYARIERGVPGFLVYPQNAEDIVLTEFDLLDAESERYFTLIDGIGIEDLFYNGQRKQRRGETAFRVEVLHEFSQRGKAVVVTDYVINSRKPTAGSSRKRAEKFYRLCLTEGFTPYAAHSDRELDELVFLRRADRVLIDQPAEPPLAGVDVNLDGLANVDDVAALLLALGPCPGGCPADLTGDAVVDGSDLRRLLCHLGYDAATHSGGTWKRTVHDLYRSELLPRLGERSKREQRLDKRTLRLARKAL